MLSTIVKEAGLPDSCMNVYEVILTEGPLNSKEIVSKVSCSTRSVRYALKRLLEHEYVEKQPHLKDMRQTLYFVNINKLQAELALFRGIK